MKIEQTYRRFWALLAFQGLLITALSAQKIDTIEVWLDTNIVKTLQYATLNDNIALSKTELKAKSYPVVLIPESFFKQVLKVNKERVFLTASMQTKIDLMDRKEAISELQIRHLTDYIALQKAHIVDCDTANSRLNTSIVGLNDQLDKAIKLSETSVRHERFKKIGIGVVAALAGFAFGSLLHK